jgi:hypothetical protein
MERKKDSMLREAAPEYKSAPEMPLAEVFWLAFKALPRGQQFELIERLLNDPDYYEEIADAVAVIEAQDEPSRPLEEVEEELRREGLL